MDIKDAGLIIVFIGVFAMILYLFVILSIMMVFAMVQLTGAEEVSCNTFWCEFKLPSNQEIHQTCFQDGHQVNCSEILNDINQSTLIINEQ